RRTAVDLVRADAVVRPLEDLTEPGERADELGIAVQRVAEPRARGREIVAEQRDPSTDRPGIRQDRKGAGVSEHDPDHAHARATAGGDRALEIAVRLGILLHPVARVTQAEARIAVVAVVAHQLFEERPRPLEAVP